MKDKKLLAQPNPLIFHCKLVVPQNTIADQQFQPTVDIVQSDFQAAVDGDTTNFPTGCTVTVTQKQ